MLPTDSDWFANDGNEEITHDWTNAIERSVDAVAGGDSDGVYPAVVGTTLPWGGLKIIFWQRAAGIAGGVKEIVDDSFDYRNRFLWIIGGGAYNAANQLPDGAGWTGTGNMGFNFIFTPGIYWTGDGATDGDPPGGSNCWYTLDAGNAYIYADETDGYKLKLRNGTAGAFYPFLVFAVSDQFPARLP